MTASTGSLAAALFPIESQLPAFRLRRNAPQPPDPRRPEAAVAVLDVTKFFGDTTGGVRTYLLEKARYVESRPWLRQTILLPAPRDALTQSDGVRVYRLRGPRIPAQRPYRFMLASRLIGRIIRHEQPDVIELGSPYLIPWIVRRATRRLETPLVWHYHANFPRLLVPRPELAPLPSRLAVAAAWWYVRALGRRVDLVLAGSEFVAADLRWAGVPRVEVVPLGVDVAHFNTGRRSRRAETRARLGLPDEPLAAYVGRFAREKEIEIVVRGWRRVRQATGARLVLLGDGPAARRLRGMTGAEEVIWLPYEANRDQLADFLAAIDVYVAPGPLETFGLSAAEALASGTPLLSVDHGAVPEQVRASGAGAVYVRGSANAMADVAIAMFRGEYGDLRALGEAGRTYSEIHRSWDVVFDRLFDIYRALL